MSRHREKHGIGEESKKDPSSSGPAPESKIPAEPAAETEKENEQLAALQDRFLRLQADFENFRKRTVREKNELLENANQAIMLELLTVLDHLHLGMQAASEHGAKPAFQEGLALIYGQFMEVLARFGLSRIESENKPFDANLFEAVNAMPSDTVPEGTVLAQVRRGYMFRNKLLRPAQVIVSSGKPAQPGEAAPEGAGGKQADRK